MLFVLLLIGSFCKSIYGQPNTGQETYTEKFVPCEEGWYYFENKCYKTGGHRSAEYVTWEEASNYCNEMGGKLASVHSQEQNDFFKIFLAAKIESKETWIGLSDRDNESIYVWEDGSPLNYQNWARGQPDDYLRHGGEDCVEIQDYGEWNDLNCNRRIGYTCQKDSNKELKSKNLRLCSDEDGGGWKYKKSCFIYVNEKKSWKDAEQYCQNTFNGHLTTILDKEYETFFLFTLPKTRSPFWIGLKTQDKFQQMWTADIPVFYNNLDKRLEELECGTCILRWDQYAWTTELCDAEYRFICERVDPPAIKKPAQRSKCPEFPYDWRDFGGEYCYFLQTERLDWDEAQFDCGRRGGMLATIHSREEEEVLKYFLKSLTRVYIGLNSLSSNGYTYTWLDGSQLTYTHWESGQPNDKNEMCVLITTKNMAWHDYSCSTTEASLCEVKKVPDEISIENRNVEDDECKKKNYVTTLPSYTTDEIPVFPSYTTDETPENISRGEISVACLFTIITSILITLWLKFLED